MCVFNFAWLFVGPRGISPLEILTCNSVMLRPSLLLNLHALLSCPLPPQTRGKDGNTRLRPQTFYTVPLHKSQGDLE